LSPGDGARAPVLLLHGQPGSGADWEPIRALLEPDHLVLAPDRPGYGSAPGPALGPTGNAEVLAATLAGVGRRAVVAGHSYGAAIALRLAELRPELVAALVLVCPAGSPRSLNAIDRAMALPGVGEAAGWVLLRGGAAAARWAFGRALPMPPPASVATWRDGRAWRSFAVEQRGLVEELPELVRALPSVRASVDILAGRRDRVVPPSAADELAGALPSSRVTWVPDSGHLLPWEQPELVAAVIARSTRNR